MTIKNNQIEPLTAILTPLKMPTNLGVNYITSVVTLASELKRLHALFLQSVEALFKSYDIKPVNGGYNWVGNEKEAEISEKYRELTEMSNTVNVELPDDPELYAKIGQGLSVAELLFLKEILIN